MTFRPHRLACRAALAILVLGPATGAAVAGTGEIGVTAAVNPQVTGTPPGQPPRTLVLGNAVYHNERIRTETGGLLQVLFVDGTTFTVGPGTDLVIDSYVFDPATGTGKIAATMAKGVLRFVGGKISKAPNAVEINTLSGTIGIRGAVVNIDARSRSAGRIMFEFGRSASFCRDGRCMKLFQQGWLYETGPDFPQGRIRKTDPADITLIQQALAGRRGQQGGAPQQPTGGQVEQSNVASAETTPPDTQPQTGGLRPLEDGLTLEDIPGLLNPIADIATDAIAGGGDPPPPPPETELEMRAAGLLNLGGDFNVSISSLSGFVTFAGDKIENGGLFSLISDGENILGADIAFGPTDNPSVATSTSIRVWDSEVDIETQPPTTAELTVNSTPICQTCSFMRWGGWSSTVTTELTGTTNSQGVWVAGTPVPEVDLPATGVASYHGSAHATVNNYGQQYQASGNMDISWNFGERAGDMTISGFDAPNTGGGLSLSGSIAYDNEDGGFSGFLTQPTRSFGYATVNGGFVAGPANTGPDGPISGTVPQGVAGTFSLMANPGYTAAGVFGGALNQSPSAR